MGRAYSEEQRRQVRALLEAGRDEETVERETGVSDRTIRRWKLELERTGRIGKPPESRTGRHRVLSAEIEAALFQYVKDKPDLTVDDMLWWIYDNFKIVVGTRTIRRAFERKTDNSTKPGKKREPQKRSNHDNGNNRDRDVSSPLRPPPTQYQSPYAPVPTANDIETQLHDAIQDPSPQQPYPALAALAKLDDDDQHEDEETLQLQLEQIALQKREIELKLKIRRMQEGKSTQAGGKDVGVSPARQTTPSSLYNPVAAMTPAPPKRDSRSKKKIQESRRRTAERQERMLRDLERRSRRRDHLTAEWVQSKDIWPLRAQGMLADLMHQYACYVPSPGQEAVFEAMFRDLYQLVDLTAEDWDQHVHDDMLRERMRRKMAQLRAKMQRTGEIVLRTDGFGGFQKAENYTGEQAGAEVGIDENELVQDPALHLAPLQPPPPPPPLLHPPLHPPLHSPLHPAHHRHPSQDSPTLHHHHDPQLHFTPSTPPRSQDQPPSSDHPSSSPSLAYPNPVHHHHQPATQYPPIMDPHHHPTILPYAQLDSQQTLPPQESLVM